MGHRPAALSAAATTEASAAAATATVPATPGRDPRVVERVESATWDGGPSPTVAAVVSTFRRAEFLPGLVACLEAQDLHRDEFEVVLVDNGSGDDTWDELVRLVKGTPLRAVAVRVEQNRGPAPGRNAGVAEVRAPVLAITDDDCLPTPGWLRAMRLAFRGGADVVQGSVHADPDTRDAMGPWDHTIWVSQPTPFFETCNVGYRRSAFERAGGFDETDPLLHPASGRAFGEDACLAWEVIRTGGEAAWAPRSLVYHRCIPSTYERWLADQRHLDGFPGLARRSPLVARWLHRGVFLDRRSARYDLALAGVVAAAVARRPWPLLAAVPWLRMRWRFSRHLAKGRRGAPEVFARLAWSDTVAFGSMARGSIKHRRLVL